MKNVAKIVSNFIIIPIGFALRPPSAPSSHTDNHAITNKPLLRAHRKTTIDNTTLHIPAEYQGVWVGDEKFVFNGTVYPYCSQSSVVVDEESGVKALLWMSAEEFCMDIGVNQATGTVAGNWFQELLPNEAYFYKVTESQCLPESECTGDVLLPDDTSSFDYSDYRVTAKACGKIMAHELSRDVLSCKMWQTSILTPSSGGESIVVNTLTYGPDDGACPARAIYNSNELVTGSNIVGSAQMVLQGIHTDEETDIARNVTDPCTWDCYDKTNCLDTTDTAVQLPPEYRGNWIGDEKFVFNGTVYPFCSQSSVAVDEATGSQALLWMSAEEFCMDIGVNQATGAVNGNWFQHLLPNEVYFYKIIESECLPESECTGDVFLPDDTSSFDYSDYQVTAKACGKIIAHELSRDVLSCKMWQTAILTSGGESIVVNTQTYGPDSGACPKRTVYNSEELLKESDIVGSALMVLQGTFEDEETGVQLDLTDPCTWACYDKANCPS